MDIKLYDSELKVMDLLWKEGALPAKVIAERLKEQVGWSKTTTYTVIKKCIDKQVVAREDPGFLCRALISIEETRKSETRSLVDRMFGGSKDLLIASLLSDQSLTQDEINRLKKLVDDLK